MNCYECTVAGETVAAVSICRHCGVGLCLEHLRKAQAYHVGGTLYGCPHQPAGAVRPLIQPRLPRGATFEVMLPVSP